MIWVLLEITLPLCLAFLVGLGAGWLFWRWRRRSFSRSEWNKYTAGNPQDNGKLAVVQKNYAELQDKSEQLAATVARQNDELAEAEKRVQTLSDGLNDARQSTSLNIAPHSNDDLNTVDFDAADFATGDSESGQGNEKSGESSAQFHKQAAEQLASKVKELEFKSHNLETRVEIQTNELTEARKHISKLNADLKTRDTELNSQTSEVSVADLEDLQIKLSTTTAEKAKVQQDLQDISTEIGVKSKLVQDLQKKSDNLERTVEKQSDELLQANQRVQELSAEIQESQEKLIQQNDSHADELQSLQSRLSDASEQKAALESAAGTTSNQLSTADNRTQELSDELTAAKEDLIKLNDKSTTDLRALQTELDQASGKLATVEQKLQAESARASQQTSLVDELQEALEKLEATTQKQSAELEDADKKFQHVSDDLKKALERLNKEGHANTELLQAAESRLSSVSSEKAQFEKKLLETAARTEQQTKLNNELQQKLKQAETVTTERDTAISKIQQLEQTLSAHKLQTEELQRTKTALDNLDQKFKNFQSSVVANRQVVDEEKSKLQTRIEELQSTLEDERAKSLELDADKQKLEHVEAQLAQANKSTVELSGARATISDLNKQLNQTRVELAQSKDAPANSNAQQAGQLDQQSTELFHQLQEAKKEIKKLREASNKLSDVNTQLNNARTRNNQLVTRLEKAESSAGITPISVAQIKKLKAQIAEQEQTIEALLKKLKNKTSKVKTEKSKTQKAKPAATKKDLPWQKGVTKVGTPGANHKDDLTVINGIGPKIEKTLNRLGLKSWEQLATLKVADIKRVDEALVDFSGRIQRDEWVPQAKAIIRNGHKPLDSKPKKSAKRGKSKAGKKAWQQGETRFGTPGSSHRDDLKVINGIGPVIEKALNRAGIKSWEQLATLKVKEARAIDEALDFPGRIDREQWVVQAKALVKQFPDLSERPSRRTFLNQAAAR